LHGPLDIALDVGAGGKGDREPTNWRDSGEICDDFGWIRRLSHGKLRSMWRLEDMTKCRATL